MLAWTSSSSCLIIEPMRITFAGSVTVSWGMAPSVCSTSAPEIASGCRISDPSPDMRRVSHGQGANANSGTSISSAVSEP